MEIGIIGLPMSGKTTVFNALTRGNAATAARSPADKPNIGVVKVPDPRLDVLTKMFKPRKTVPAEVTYTDIPGAPEGLGKTTGIGGEFLNRLQKASALLLVVRAFNDPSVPHPQTTIDPFRDLDTMNMELAFSDMAILERRVKRLDDTLKGAKTQERDAAIKEKAILERIKAELENGTPIREQKTSPSELPLLENYKFLTAKPLLVALNIDEDQLPQSAKLEQEMAARLKSQQTLAVVLAGKLEAELAQMQGEEEEEFRKSLGAGESGLSRMLRLSYQLLGLIAFFTVGEDECRAWTITRGDEALKAAGKIHSDIERGFIRAEVIAYDDLIACGSLAEGRKKGLLRQEGKAYVVKDGDIAHFLFNV